MSILPVPDGKDAKMNLSDESLLVILVVGIAAGWLAGQIVRGTGLGLGDLVVGIAGPSDISATWDPSSSGIVSIFLKPRARCCCSLSSGSSADGADGEEAGAECGEDAGGESCRKRWT